MNPALAIGSLYASWVRQGLAACQSMLTPHGPFCKFRYSAGAFQLFHSHTLKVITVPLEPLDSRMIYLRRFYWCRMWCHLFFFFVFFGSVYCFSSLAFVILLVLFICHNLESLFLFHHINCICFLWADVWIYFLKSLLFVL